MSKFKKQHKAFQLMAKPVGPKCNLNCDYCFYLEKEVFYKNKKTVMSRQVLETYIKKYIESQDCSEIEFVWQGGEPTIAGLDFYKEAVKIQNEYSNGRIIRNSFQTNGIILDEDWCKFFTKNNFLIGISLDGPREIHNFYRKDGKGNPTFDKVMKAVKLMKALSVDFNVMACVTNNSSKKPLEVYRFFKSEGIDFIQFTPIVERIPDDQSKNLGLKLGSPYPDNQNGKSDLMPWSVDPQAYGDFLIAVFDEWVRKDVGSTNIMNFEWALASWLSLPSTLCVFSKQCGSSLIIEHNGDIYSCDHFMYPQYCIGNILNDDLTLLVKSQQQISFGKNKAKLLDYCKDCNFLFACHGGCPKHRFDETTKGKRGLNYLCPSYKKFYTHVNGYMKIIAELILNDQPASKVMQIINNPLFNLNS